VVYMSRRVGTRTNYEHLQNGLIAAWNERFGTARVMSVTVVTEEEVLDDNRQVCCHGVVHVHDIVKSFLFIGHLIKCIWWVRQSTN